MPRKKAEAVELTLKEKLMTADHEKLVDALVSLNEGSGGIQKQLTIVLAGLDENPAKIRGVIHKEIQSLKRSRRFIDYYEADGFADHLDSLRLRIINDVKAKSPQIAFESMIDFLDLHEETLNHVDDSNGSVSGVFMAACTDLGTIAQTCNLSVSEIVDIVFSLFMENDYGIYDEIIVNFHNALKDEGLSLLQEKLEQTTNEDKKIRVKIGLEAIADCKNDVDAYIRACSFFQKPSAHDHLDIAKRLIKHWRSKEALEWLESMDIPIDHHWQQERKALKIHALDLEGDYEQAQKERLSWFSETLDPGLYKDILKAAKPETQAMFKSDAPKQAMAFADVHKALHFLIETQDFCEAANLVFLRYNEFNGRQYYTLRPAAKLLEEIDPIASTLLYRKLIEPVLEETKSKYYKYAAKDLVKCAALRQKITDWKNLQNHDDYFQEISLKHKRKISFWDAHQEALKKQAGKDDKVIERR